MSVCRVAVLLALLCLLLCGCGGTDPAAETTVPPETTAAPVEPATITLAADGKCLFSIVRPDAATEEEVTTTVNILNTAEAAFGSAPEADTDWAIPKGRHVVKGFEILIGRTEAEESKAVYRELPYGSYTVRVVGEKLVVAAWEDEAYAKLRNMVYRLLMDNTEDGVCAIPADYNETKSLRTTLDDVPRYAGDISRLVDLGDDSFMFYIEDAEESNFTAYCDRLKGAGYTLYAEHEAADNRFASYIGAYNLHVYYTAYADEMRIIVDPADTPLPDRAADIAAFQTVTEPKVSMIGLNYSLGEKASNGLCMAFLLPNGEFILVDGGFVVTTETDYLYKRLQEIAPDPNNIVIAGWFLTHAHSDHTPAFDDFVTRHHADVTIRQVVFNFTTEAQYDIKETGTTEAKVRDILAILDKTEVIKTHTGQVFHYPGAAVEMLFTFDDYLPKDLPYVNATSLIFRVDLGGQTTMILGDASEHITPLACKMYGDYLESDIVQVSHHGYDGATPELYNRIGAHTALWPSGQTVFDKQSSRACNQTLFRISRDLYIARFDVITLSLPYTPVGNNDQYVEQK